MLISYNNFYVTNCANTLCSVDVSFSFNSNVNDPLINIFDKNFNFSFYNSNRLSFDVRKYQKKFIEILAIWMSCPSFSYFCFLLIFQENGKMILASNIILTSIAFLVYILYRFSKPHNKLKSSFSFQFFTYDTIEITNEVNTSHSQSELSIFAISKCRFKNDNSFCPLLLLLLGDISLNPEPFSNPQLFKEEE